MLSRKTSSEVGVGMSLESDARDCLIEAVREDTGLILTPGQLETVKPGKDLQYDDGFAWLHTLDIAVSCLRDRGHVVRNADRVNAGKLLSEFLTASVRYLVGLGRNPAQRLGTVRRGMP